MAIAKLTVAEIKAQMKKPGRRLIGDGAGLWLHKGAALGVASWVFRYERGGKVRHVGLGPLHTISLEMARTKAQEVRAALLEGRDPAEERATHKRTATSRAARAAALGKTFEELALEHIERNAPGWAEKAKKAALAAGKEPPKKGSENQWRQSLTEYAFPILGRLRPDEIQTEDVLRVLQQETTARDGTKGTLWNTKNETAARVRGRIENILDAAMARGVAAKRPNPAAWTGALEHLLPARAKVHKPVPFAALDWREIPKFMRDLRKRPGDGARALEVAILTGARTNEVVGLKWSDLHDLQGEEAAWLLADAAMKMGERHAVPLPARVVDILTAQPRRPDCAHVLAAQKSADAPWLALGENAMLAVLDEMKVAATVHGMRAAFRTWVLENTTFKKELAELCLAHTTGESDAERSYIRGSAFDQRRELLEAWAHYCEGLPPVDPHVRVPAKRGAKLTAVG
ncbi:tyrosine-type recombinase/integrase [Variovorax soli]|uniref:tyrosine-type recombinase/integrase n=1 Tax=Variovorax soli TaxID=376815 RepID=UPI0008389CA0|nr:integrase family protein [Variovorax soli]